MFPNSLARSGHAVRLGNVEMQSVVFTSTLDLGYRDALERLFFYNGNQNTASDAILLAIERFGSPRIEVIGSRLWVSLDSGLEAQSLFVLDPSQAGEPLVGIVVYTRDNDTLVILFLAVREDFSSRGTRARELLFFRIVDEVRSVARRIRGISSITMFLRGATAARIPVK